MMAKIFNGGVEIRGRVRDLVFRKMKSGNVVSGYNERTYEKMKWTDKQDVARRRFALLCKLGSRLKRANDVGFRGEMVYASQPCFVRHNYSMLEVGDDGGLRVDYERLCLSHGTLAMLSGVRGRMVDGEMIFGWDGDVKSGGEGSDRVVAVLYCPDCDGDLVGDCVVEVSDKRRSDGELRVKAKSYWKGKKIYGYLFAYDRDGRSSNSQFVGGVDFEEVGERRLVCYAADSVDGTGEEGVFQGFSQEDREIGGEIKRCFVIRFSVEDELKEEVLVEPTAAADFVRPIVDGVRRLSKAESIALRMKELIRDLNPEYYREMRLRGEDLTAGSWDELCRWLILNI